MSICLYVCTYDVVVVAAHSIGAARVACAHADNADRRAVETNEGGDILDDDAQETEDGSNASVVSLRSACPVSASVSNTERSGESHLRFGPAGNIGSGP